MPLAQGEKTLFIQFDDSESFSAYAGCNYINGKYQFSDKKTIKFSKTIATKMACPNMQTEQEFLKTFRRS